MPPESLEPRLPTTGRSATLLTFSGIAAAFGVASCCALPILLTTAGLSAAWMGGIAAIAAPYRNLLLGISALSLIGGVILLWRAQQTAVACGPDGICTPPALRVILLLGLLFGAVLLWFGYSYV